MTPSSTTARYARQPNDDTFTFLASIHGGPKPTTCTRCKSVVNLLLTTGVKCKPVIADAYAVHKSEMPRLWEEAYRFQALGNIRQDM